MAFAPWSYILIQHHPKPVVKAVEMAWIIDIMVAVAVINPPRAVSLAITVRNRHRSLPPRYILVIYVGRFWIRQPRINRVIPQEVHQRIISIGAPAVAEIISHLGIPAPLAEIEMRHIAVCAVVGQ